MLEFTAAPAPTRNVPALAVASATRKRTAHVRVGAETIDVVLEATAEVPEAMLSTLARTLGGVRVDRTKQTDLASFLTGSGELKQGQPEVRLPTLPGVMFTWTDGWEIARPRVLRLREAYLRATPTAPPSSGSPDVGVAVQALTGSWTQVDGQLLCKAPDDPAPLPLPFVTVIVGGQSQLTDANGRFSFSGSWGDVSKVTVKYDGHVPPVGTAAQGPRISVMNDWHNPHSEDISAVAGTTSGGVLTLSLPTLGSLDCELFQSGAAILQEYHRATRRDPAAADDFRIKRWDIMSSADGADPFVPHAYYDYVVIANDFRRFASARALRYATLSHEFGHTLRHAADGDLGHWGWDSFRWAYTRFHDGNEIANEQYAFNEGWGNFWACTRTGVTAPCPVIRRRAPSSSDMDWNELRVAERLVALSATSGVGSDGMELLLRENPGTIHTLMEFERAFCGRFRTNSFCRSGAPVRTKSACPSQYHDDGATCRLDNILAKSSYGRGVGTLPIGCSSGQKDLALCYAPCRPDFTGVGPICWRNCPPGMHDDGAFCRRDVNIISSDNSSCPWWDVCGLVTARGCSTCPAGYQNDGCTCRIDAWIFAKESYGRGAGEIPTQCARGQQYDAGLCYQPCRAGWSGVGPVCWGSCPAGYADHGATCYRDPQIIVKY